MNRRTFRLDDGSIGYGMHQRTDDCLVVALASALQVPPERLPDLELDRRVAAGEDPDAISRESWAKIAEALHERGLRLAFHDTAPVDHERWVGIIPGPPPEVVRASLRRVIGPDYEPPQHVFSDHAVVMSYDRLIFDPAIGLKVPFGLRLRRYRASDVTRGISIEKE